MKKIILAASILMTIGDSAIAAQPAGNGNSSSAAPAVFVDGAGKIIGRVVPQPATANIAGVLVSYQTESVAFALTLDQDAGTPRSTGFKWVQGVIFFATGDCTGQAYIIQTSAVGQGGARWAMALAQGNQWTGYVSLPNAAFQTTTFASVLNATGCHPTSSGGPALPVAASFPLDALGIPPFFMK
ncbi:MAG: hypothetical protein JWR22_2827 [Herminiimonas sp.]|nr:hypothetical protein [Herminiimonas sp.]